MAQTGRRRTPSSGGNTKGRKEGFGSIRALPSGRVQARYTGPDGLTHHAPTTFQTKGDARAYLALVQGRIIEGRWKPTEPKPSVVTLGEYADVWLADRDLKPRTRAHYQKLLDNQLAPMGDIPLSALTPVVIRKWHADLGTATPTLRAHAYALLRTVLGSAVDDGSIPSNPCHIRGAGNARRVHKIKPCTLAELETIVSNMPERYRLMVVLAAWCALRFGELTELRRSDIDTKAGKIKIRRAVVYVNGKAIVGTPKSDAGTRDVAIPPHLLPAVKTHIADHAQFGRDALLFTGKDGKHLAPASLHRYFYLARKAAQRPDLRFHDLRHTGAVLAAQTGATLAELMGRLGHSTPAMAIRYQHVAADRDMEIARRLSEMVTP